MKNIESFYPIISQNQAIKTALFDLVVKYRMLTWCADEDYANQAKRFFHQNLHGEISAKLDASIVSSQNRPKLIQAIIKVMNTMVSRHRLNIFWISQLVTMLYMENSISTFGNYRDPIKSILFEHESQIYAYHLKAAWRIPVNVNQKSQGSKLLRIDHQKSVLARREINKTCREYLSEMISWNQPPLLVTFLFLIIIFLLCSALGLVPHLGTAITVSFSIIASYGFNSYLPEQVNNIVCGIEMPTGIPTQRSYFCYANLPIQFRQNLEEQLNEIIGEKPTKPKERRQIQPKTSQSQRDDSSLPPMPSPPASEVKKTAAQPQVLEKKPNTLKTEFELRSARYLPNLLNWTSPEPVKETVVFTLPDQTTLVWRVGYPHDQIVRLWSTPKPNDPFKQDCVFYQESKQDSPAAEQFLNAASFGHVNNSGTGYIFIENRGDSKDFPEATDINGIRKLPRYKLKTMHSEDRRAVYFYGIFASNQGNNFHLHVLGSIQTIKH